MSLQYKIGLGLGALLVAFSLGRYTAGQKLTTTKTETQTQTEVKDNKDVHQVETITKQPNGATTETITTDTVDVKQTEKDSQSKTLTEEKPANLPKTNFSALFGYDLSVGSKALIPLYGVSIQREVLGDVTVGGFGLTNGVVGVSLGINF